MTTVVHCKKERYDIYIGRPGRGLSGSFGNPFRLGKGGDREMTIMLYRRWFYNKIKTDQEFKKSILELKDKVLGCWCKPYKSCHGDIIAEYLNNLD